MIVLGRIFEMNPRSHGVHRLLHLAETHLDIFSKAALEKRKRLHAGEWTQDFMRDAYVPTPRDFKGLQRYADRQRTIYKNKYKVLRDRFFAHRDRADVTGFFAKTSIPELEQLLRFLSRLHDALWELFTNGRKPNLRPARYSARQILKLPQRLHRNSAESEWITRETEKLLKYLAGSGETPHGRQSKEPGAHV
jgi:hypothetical protein